VNFNLKDNTNFNLNKQMNVEEVLKIFEGIIKDPKKLERGGEVLGDLINKQPDFGIITCKVITSGDFDLNFRKLTGYLVKEVLKDNWMSSSALASQRKVSNFDPTSHPFRKSRKFF